MRRLTAARDRFGQARDLAPALDAACDAFEEILAVIGNHEDTNDPPMVPLLLAASQTTAQQSCPSGRKSSASP
jgi:hypothetical protein